MRQKKIGLTEAIVSLVPGAQVVVIGEEITWIEPSEAPVTLEEIKAEQDRLQSLEPLRIAQESRASAYKSEADPLFFKAQRGEIEEQEWLNKVEEIRERFPYPTIETPVEPPVTEEPVVEETEEDLTNPTDPEEL